MIQIIAIMIQINKIEVTYDKFSKQVDVHALKGILWNTIKQSTETSQTVN